MTSDPLERNLAKILEGEREPEGLEPGVAYRKALLARTKAGIAAGTGTRPAGRILEFFLATAAAAALFIGVMLSSPPGPARVAADTAFAERIRDAKDVPAFSAEPLASVLYADPAEHLRRGGVDTSLTGLVDFYLRLADGEKSKIEMAKYATLDALSRRAGTAFGPLLATFHDRDGDPEARLHILLFIEKRRDRVLLPWLDARLADAGPKLLPKVAAARAALDVPGREAAKALRARAMELGILDPGSPKYDQWSAPGIVKALAELEGAGGGGEEKTAHLLAEKPTVDLLAAACEALAGRKAPAAYKVALDRLVAAAMQKDDASFDDLSLLDLLGMAGDPRFTDLLERILTDSYVPLAVEGARIAGAWRVKAAVPLLQDAARRAPRMGEDGQDFQPPVLWALARCGERDAIGKLKAFLAKMDWYRAGEWAVDALLDLDVPAEEILLALPNETYAVGKLPAITRKMTGAGRAALDARAKSLPEGNLRSALELLRDTGASPEAGDYLGAVIEGGGNIGLYLTFTDPEKVRNVLDSTGSEHDKVRAVKAIRILPVGPEARTELAAGALRDRGGLVRTEAAGLLAWLGGTKAANHLAQALKVEESAPVAERLAEILMGVKPEFAVPAVTAAFEDAKALLALPENPLATTLAILGKDRREGRGGSEGERASKLLRAVLHAGRGSDESGVIRVAAARALADPESIETLVEAAKAEAPLTRILAREALLATAPGQLRPRSGPADPLEGGYELLKEGLPRWRREDVQPALFDYEKLR